MSAASRPRPSWQTDECPAWCVVEHREDDRPADRVHDSAGTYLHAILRRVETGEAEATELLVAASRRCGSHDDWIFIGEPEKRGQHLALSRESARRLSVALDAILDRQH